MCLLAQFVRGGREKKAATCQIAVDQKLRKVLWVLSNNHTEVSLYSKIPRIQKGA